VKKTVILLLLLAMTLSLTSCNKATEDSYSSASAEQTTEQSQEVYSTKLTNKMTESELLNVQKHSLTLLDEPKEPQESKTEQEQTEHTVEVEFQSSDSEAIRRNIENNRDQLTDEEYEEAMKYLKSLEESDNKSAVSARYILVDGYIMPYMLPNSDLNYDGGEFEFTYSKFSADGKVVPETVHLNSFEDYLDWIRKSDTESGYTADEIEQDILRVQIAYDALESGVYEILPEGTVDVTDSSLYYDFEDGNGDYRDTWEFDRKAVEAIKDSVDEIDIYDKELDKQFIVHVTLPPDYDKDKAYPVFFLTDGIWRFGNCPELRKCMENGEAAPVIIVSLYYSYDVIDPDQGMRYEDLVINRSELLDFITDNLMPYLCENYKIDCSDSTLYGHSDGGVFTHYALFNSDNYENQPFGHYIIGSPALWGLRHYNTNMNISNDNFMNDYGYFDRNEKLDKTVFLCAGSLEDPDYADKYREGDDTTLEGVAKLKERLEAHGAELTYKLYDSHHYQYIPEMLVEYLKQMYPYNHNNTHQLLLNYNPASI